MDLVPTSELIKDIDVVIEEVLDCEVTSQDSVQVESEQQDETPDLFSQDQQIPLTFDFPIKDKSLQDKNDEVDTESNVNNIESSFNHEEKVVFTLDDDDVQEEVKQNDKDFSSVIKETEPTVVEVIETTLENKGSEPEIIEAKEESSKQDLFVEKNDPFDTPIDSVLKSRTEERRKSLKEYNHKFSSHIDDLEKQPAYKRKGLDLDFSNQS